MGGIEAALCCTCTIVMLTLAFANVVGRYVLHSSISFTEEIVCGLFVLLSMMGTSIAIKYQSHLGLSILTDRLPRRLQSILAVLANLLGAGVAVMLIKLGWEMIQTQIRLGSITATLQWPAWIYSMAIPVGGVFMLIRFVQAAVCKALDKEVL
ncbi:TRAP transporter small permease [Dysosmobacter sp.]|uniref:TRAP transporter small permease n=1 Tax=Dysosmobacter sp. TaxID=2591382 RepID=UPI002D7F0CB5|nr:TRAP transporter small permease [Dysosmobacter sp.]